MAKARGKGRATPKAPRVQPEQPPAAEAAKPVEQPVVLPEEQERASGRAQLITAAVVVASAAATFLLLSGWTPGPGQPAPQRVAASPTPAKKAAPKTKKTVKPKPRKVRKRPRSAPLTTLQVSKQLFQGECGFCHTLAAAGTTGRVGPNLDKLRPTRKRVLAAIAAGGRRTGLMPPDILTGSDALNVAIFVAKATRR